MLTWYIASDQSQNRVIFSEPVELQLKGDIEAELESIEENSRVD
jgi:hypothetical protein